MGAGLTQVKIPFYSDYSLAKNIIGSRGVRMSTTTQVRTK